MDSLKVEEALGSRTNQEAAAAAAAAAAAPNGRSETASTEMNTNENRINIEKERKKNKKKKLRIKSSYLPKIGCLRIEQDEEGNFDAAVDTIGEPANPAHLVVMVNGIIGSAENWKFAAKQFLNKYPRDVIVYCSKTNSGTLTFDGVDVMGARLAEEVISVIKRHPSVKKISFIGHSLGGLVARYAIAKLYGHDLTKELSQGNGDCKSDVNGDTGMEDKIKNRIAGLEPVNFITLATPHLGSRWHKQVPLFCGSYTMEKVAARISWFLGRTGKHLFLTDGDNGKPPLLLQMVSDSEDLKFMSALQSFERHVAYANIRFDNLVGWSTSSLRRQNELPKRRHLSRDEKYPHIVHVEPSTTSGPQQEFPLDAKVDGCKSVNMEGIRRKFQLFL
ncbi:lipid droplet phospholipase 1 isoform X2 [Hevea brasiliensis]|uniref:lipid droplet phospholipase 1 isoform X2 n=1 Tax=Hevea brasiliensis TaxID=3981 RepID=UPI0025F0DE2D|nr:lipid droplet phospholipase 1 isoform X2 [Hevea brasiliensis]